jgi:hypothetical protein
MVLVFSAAANSSKHVPREVAAADGRGLPIIPVRLENVEPSQMLRYFISEDHWLDADGVEAQWPLVQAVNDAIQHCHPSANARHGAGSSRGGVRDGPGRRRRLIPAIDGSGL